jgi:hypothetical protein
MGVKRMIHVSSLGAREDHPSRFLSTKAKVSQKFKYFKSILLNSLNV